MRINNNPENGMVWQGKESPYSLPETTQVQSAVSPSPSQVGKDGRASMRQAETGINAGLVADNLQKELQSLASILKDLLSLMESPSRQQQGRVNDTGGKADGHFPPSNSSGDKQSGFGNANLGTPLAVGRRFTPGIKPYSFSNGNLGTSPAIGRRFTPTGSSSGAAAAPQAPPPTQVGGTVNVSNQSGAQSETDIAIDPTNPNHIIGGSNDISTGSMRVYESVDGGKSWTNKAMPSAPSPYNGFASDPAVTFDGQGNAYYSYLGVQASIFGASGTTLVVSKKPAGASSWGAPVVVPNVNADKNLMTADRTNSQFKGNVYVAWDNNNQDQTQSLMVARSADGGKTFSATKVNNNGTNVIGADPVVGPNGEVYTAWSNYAGNEHNIYINSSLDGGKTWGKTDNLIQHWNADTGEGLAVKPAANPQRGVPIFPSIDVDRSNGPNRGTLYCVYNDTQPGGKNLDVYLKSSKDGGKTWSAAVKVNDDGPNRDHFLPRVAVDDKDGSVNIGWYDTRGDSANKKADFFYARSTDGGKTFEKNVKVNQTPLDESGSGADPNGFGDYSGIAALNGVVRPLWAGRTTGSQAEDIFSAAITNDGSTPPSPSPNPNPTPGPNPSPSPSPEPPDLLQILLELLKEIFGF